MTFLSELAWSRGVSFVMMASCKQMLTRHFHLCWTLVSNLVYIADQAVPQQPRKDPMTFGSPPVADLPAVDANAVVARARDAGTTRQLLLEAARHRFARDGYAATTVRDIASD